MLPAAPTGLAGAYDAALVDLDGVVYLGGEPVAGAAEGLAAARAAGMRLAFVTNNASRTPQDVAAVLAGLGVPATAQDVVTSAQAAARMLAQRLPAGSPVLVVGGAGLRRAVAEVGLREVAGADEHPAAVVQGFAPDVGYAQLAEAALAVRAGALWVASNRDSTLPSPRGLLPGNGALVAAVATATGATPEFAGKPDRPLLDEAVRRTGARHALMVGDRLDTDIEGAAAAGLDSLLVLTGVSRPEELLTAAGPHRPTFLAAGLGDLVAPHPEVQVADGAATCRGWRVRVEADGFVVQPPEGGGDRLDGLRAACALAWTLADRGAPVPSSLPAALDGWRDGSAG